MARQVLCIHPDQDVRERVAAAVPPGFVAAGAASLAEGTASHGRAPADVVAVPLDDVETVRTVSRWHPRPAVVTLGEVAEVLAQQAIAAGAYDHADPGELDEQGLRTVLARSWRRHRAARTSAAQQRLAPDLADVRRRVAQIVSLTAAASDLLTIEEAPHTTVRSLLEQAGEIGHETVHLTGRAPADDTRAPLDLAALVQEAWTTRTPRGSRLVVEVDDVTVHGHAGMLRTALVIVLAHALRGIERSPVVHVDTELLADALRLRVHDDGPPVPLVERQRLFLGGDDAVTPMLLTVEHVASRHGGTAWIADSDRFHDGTMAVVELPLRTSPR